IFSLGQGPSSEQVRQLERAGIQVVFIDFFSRPFRNLEPSLEVLGKVVGRTAETGAFLELRRSRMALIADRLKANAPESPAVFLEAHAGLSECCNSPGRGNIGDYIEFLGARNI